MTVQPGLCRTWLEPQIVGFLMHRLICCISDRVVFLESSSYDPAKPSFCGLDSEIPTSNPYYILHLPNWSNFLNFRQGSISGDSSSTVSQTSYDPAKPSFRGLDSEIPTPDTVSVDTSGTAETQGSGSSAGAGGQGPTFTKKSKGENFIFFWSTDCSSILNVERK